MGGSLLAQKNYPPVIEGATEHLYKTVGDVALKLWELNDGRKDGAARPAIVFFFGGGWRSGSPAQFEPQARILAERGMVAFLADYRVLSRHGTRANTCVEDARDAIRFVRRNAAELGVDPERIASAGGSAGGHIAACLGVMSQDPESAVQAMALFNPACVLAPLDGVELGAAVQSDSFRDRMGVDPIELSPAHHVTRKAPPGIIFHGREDAVVDYAAAEAFASRMKEAGVRCVLHGYEGAGHGFFNYGRKTPGQSRSAFERTMEQLDEFLVELGWLEEE